MPVGSNLGPFRSPLPVWARRSPQSSPKDEFWVLFGEILQHFGGILICGTFEDIFFDEFFRWLEVFGSILDVSSLLMGSGRHA